MTVHAACTAPERFTSSVGYSTICMQIGEKPLSCHLHWNDCLITKQKQVESVVTIEV
ncbi:hypothetical protein [Vibrio tetraodonis]|uniref:hypothetical protein n=1 Tax=Vibrio tetraodonis TaxID=2231647 RepID=UPI00136FEF45|nr:hypothetical protein [Vibrio tetraodonis]